MEDFRSGFIGLVGRPNAGKSTLMNALVDADIAITSSKPETTRKSIRGIRTDSNSQLIFVDTPGIHKPKTLLGKRLNQVVDDQISNVDVLLFLTPADEKIGKGDEFILKHLEQLKRSKVPIIAVVTKIDKISKQLLLVKLDTLNSQGFNEVVPLSAKTDENLEVLVEILKKYVPISEKLYDDEVLTDESKFDMISEVIRGTALEDLKNELPHSLIVQVDEQIDNDIFVNLFVERDSQKPIIIGKAGENIRKIRIKSTKIVKEMLNNKEIKLNLKVKIAKDWQKNTKMLEKFGL